MARTAVPFSIDLPDSWEDQTIYTFKGPDDGDTRHYMTLVLDRSAGDVDLETYADEQIDATLESLSGAEELKRERKELPGGHTVYESVFRWIPADRQRIFRKQSYLIQGGIAYAFACNFSKKTLKTLGAQMDLIIDTVTPAS